MTDNNLTPAAQYVRMSTEHQQYSFENQSAAIQQYAQTHGFEVVHTYSDAAKRGIVLKNRAGLQQLLQDVIGRSAHYKVILVYDVSRWGRFQDTDESAHYEFLCKNAGVPVHYCAEAFANDGSLSSLIMKALKRTMAGEYSRELGVKVLAGQKRLAHLGFKQGGVPGYGLRRMLVSATGTLKQELTPGERKSIATDRVILILGPPQEVKVVTDIYRMLVSEKKSVYAIACELNRCGVKYIGASQWDYQAVYSILTSPKYVGCHVFGRTSSKLSTPTIALPESDWVLVPGAFEACVDHATFSAARRILHDRTINRTDNELLDSLRSLLASSGRLSLGLIKNSVDLPSPSTYRHRFGSVQHAYELIGYGRPDQFNPIDLRRRTQALRGKLIAEIVALFPDDVSLVKRGGRWRSRLQLRNGPIVSVLIARSIRTWKDTMRWQIDPVRHECECITLLACTDNENLSFSKFYVLPNIDRSRRFYIRTNDAWLNRGLPLFDLPSFCIAVCSMKRSFAVCQRLQPLSH